MTCVPVCGDVLRSAIAEEDSSEEEAEGDDDDVGRLQKTVSTTTINNAPSLVVGGQQQQEVISSKSSSSASIHLDDLQQQQAAMRNGSEKRDGEEQVVAEEAKTSPPTLPPKESDDGADDEGESGEKITKNSTNNPSSFTMMFPSLLSLALFSYGGEFLRYIFEHLFGLACHEPDIVAPALFDRIRAPCTTAPGTTESTGGAFFTDIPANVIGCFIMGLLVSGDSDMLGVDLPMAILSRSNPFQQWKITHLGLRTGFCGALTTFASWNTQMVVMLCGREGTDLMYSQWVSVLWGYSVGWMVAIESFRVGKDFAHALSRYNNPQLAKEADVIREKRELGELLNVNRDLPDFERRFLHDIMINDDDDDIDDEDEKEDEQPTELPAVGSNTSVTTPPAQPRNPKKLVRRQSSLIDEFGSVSFSFSMTTSQHHQISAALQQSSPDHNSNSTRRLSADLHKYGSESYKEKYGDHIHHLQEWKDSTDKHRRQVGSPYANELHEIERAILVEEQQHYEPRPELLETIRDAGWNYDALKNWKDAVTSQQEVEEVSADTKKDSSSLEFTLHLVVFVVCTGLLIWGAIHYDDEQDPVEKNYRTQMISCLFAPPGTILRWLLSKWNGSITYKNWEWLPIGTLIANMMASVISVLMPAIELHVDSALAHAFMGAIKTGFAGSLSTVSTFAAETVGLFRALPQNFWGYYYSFGSLLLAGVLGVIAYVWAVA